MLFSTSTQSAEASSTPTATMPPVQSDIRILDKLLALNLTVTLWSARKKMTAEDMGGVNLPPEDLASLGSKRIADPESIKIFGTLKARAVSFLDRHGVRFMAGLAIPEDAAGTIVTELISIRDEFLQAKDAFLSDYDQSIQNWIAKHKEWGEIIKNSTVGPDYVRSRMDFKWQMFKVSPLMEHDNQQAVLQSGLAEEVIGLGGTLFGEIAKTADDIWHRVYEGVTSVTHKALSPLRTLHQKLVGLSFVEPHVAPIADIIDTALNRMPPKGNIVGADLLLLQGLVCLLRDNDALLIQAQSLIDGYGPASVMDSLLSASQAQNPKPGFTPTSEDENGDGYRDSPFTQNAQTQKSKRKGTKKTETAQTVNAAEDNDTDVFQNASNDRGLLSEDDSIEQSPVPPTHKKSASISSLGLW